MITPQQLETSALTLLDCFEKLGFTDTDHDGLAEAVTCLRAIRSDTCSDLYQLQLWTVVLLIPDSPDDFYPPIKSDIQHVYADTLAGAIYQAQQNALHEHIPSEYQHMYELDSFAPMAVFKGKVEPSFTLNPEPQETPTPA